jgi:hypothetical protein
MPTLSEPAKSTKWNLETTVAHSPVSSSMLSRESPERKPSALEGLNPPLPIADAKLGVGGRPDVDEATEDPAPVYMDPGRASRDGERPLGGRGDDDRGGGPEPVYFL